MRGPLEHRVTRFRYPLPLRAGEKASPREMQFLVAFLPLNEPRVSLREANNRAELLLPIQTAASAVSGLLTVASRMVAMPDLPAAIATVLSGAEAPALPDDDTYETLSSRLLEKVPPTRSVSVEYCVDGPFPMKGMVTGGITVHAISILGKAMVPNQDDQDGAQAYAVVRIEAYPFTPKGQDKRNPPLTTISMTPDGAANLALDILDALLSADANASWRTKIMTEIQGFL